MTARIYGIPISYISKNKPNSEPRRSDMIDGNTAALKQYEERTEKQEIAYCSLMKEIEGNIYEIQKLIDECYSMAEDYDGYDFTEDVRDEIEILL